MVTLCTVLTVPRQWGGHRHSCALLGTLGPLVPFAGLTFHHDGFGVLFGFWALSWMTPSWGERVYAHEQQAALNPLWRALGKFLCPCFWRTYHHRRVSFVYGEAAGPKFFAPLGWVVILALICSIVESQLILPSHWPIAVAKLPTALAGRWKKFQGRLSNALQNRGKGVPGRFYTTPSTALRDRDHF
ncbi:MAG: hypothetical protein CM15mP120_10640 [Pseudomonadota bacterium]|nr:MAG: hypothetical protein CM15mP120_10640 [Pseudomonadota bacterium]